MDNNEGLTLAKMAVGVLLLCLLLSAVLFIWYLSLDAYSVPVDKWEQAAITAAKDRLDELVWQSDNANPNNISEFPLVTNVCNALDEFNDDGLIFVSIYTREPSGVENTVVYTYTNVPASSLGNPHSGAISVINSTTPVTAATSKLLYTYSAYRCKLSEIHVTYSSGNYISDPATRDLIAYDIQIFID